jgi:arginase
MTDPRYAIIEAPSILGLFPKGVERLPEALLRAGLLEKLGARHAGRVEPPAYDSRRDPYTKMLNACGIAAYTRTLAYAITPCLAAGETPVVLILLGCLLALRRRGRSGLLFMDGHADFYQPEAEPNGEAASMDLALAVGRGPALVTDVDGLRPLVREEDVVAFGMRDGDDAAAHGSQHIEESAILYLDLASVRTGDAGQALRHGFARLARPELDGFWLHLDADMLDDGVMPAVDYRMPGGLSFDEFEEALALASA